MQYVSRSALLAFALLLGACGGGNDNASITIAQPGVQKPGILSISASPKQIPTTTAQDYLDAFNLGKNAGARGQFTSLTWREIEPTFGAPYDFHKVTEAVDFAAEQHGFALLIGIQVINTTNREVPADLAGIQFNAAAMATRFKAMLAQMIPLFEGRVRYLSIGNEVDVYLSANPSEWTPYKTFYDDVAAYARTLDPNLRIGVTATADGALGGNAALITSLNATSDVFIATYYPLTPTFAVRTPSAPMSDFPVLLTAAGTKPIILQEVGYPSAATLGSSQELQRQFVANVFSQWRNSNGRIAFLNYFLLHDVTQAQCDAFALYYNVPGQNFKDFLCSLGLRAADGTAKIAWSQFVTSAIDAGLP